MYGRNHLRRAAALLDGPDGSIASPTALADAFAHVWAAVAFSHYWPPADRADLAGLIAASRRYGSCYETALQMTEAEVDEFREELSRAVARAARVPSQESRWVSQALRPA
jgi:hypothetical protein